MNELFVFELAESLMKFTWCKCLFNAVWLKWKLSKCTLREVTEKDTKYRVGDLVIATCTSAILMKTVFFISSIFYFIFNKLAYLDKLYACKVICLHLWLLYIHEIDKTFAFDVRKSVLISPKTAVLQFL